MRSITFVATLVLISFVSGCTTFGGGNFQILGNNLFGSQYYVSVANNSGEFLLTEPTVNGIEFADGSSKHPEPVLIGLGKTRKLPLPNPIERYSQNVEVRFKVVTLDGKHVGYITNHYTVPPAPRFNSRDTAGPKPYNPPTWIVREEDVRASREVMKY